MKYEKGVCVECRQSVLAKDGLAIDHPRRGTNYNCEGSGEMVDFEAQPIAAPPPKPVEPLPSTPVLVAPVVTTPIVRRHVPRARRETLVAPAIKREIEAARERIKYRPNMGTIDIEKLKDCDCPSLRAAIREYLSL